MKKLFLEDNKLGSLGKPKCKTQQSYFKMYKAVRNGKVLLGLNKSLDESYDKYFEFLGDLDVSFKKQAAQNIEAVIWHLGLLKYLVEELEFTPMKAEANGPDIICEKEGKRYLIELSTCSVGENYDNPPCGPENCHMGDPDYNEVKLRLSTTLDSKVEQVEKWCDQDIIQKTDDIVMIAINSCRVFESRFPDENKKSLMRNLLFKDNKLKKTNGEEFNYCFFSKHNNTRIDGILYSCIDIATYLDESIKDTIGTSNGSPYKYHLELYKNPKSYRLRERIFKAQVA